MTIMTISASHVWSDLPVSPGSVLEEEIKARGISQKELARRMGRPPQVVNEIIKAKKSISPETALELEKVLGMPAQLWVNLESVYRMTIARNRDRVRLEEAVAELSRYPVKDIEKRGWIPKFEEKTDTVRALLEFLGIASFRGVRLPPAAALRLTGGDQFSNEALEVWLRKGEIDGQRTQTADYDREFFLDSLKKIRHLTTDSPDNFLPKITELCADAGVAFVVTRELPKSGAIGAARWLGPRKGLIQLSLKWKWADVFWFTFYHEAAHLFLHEKQTFVEGPQTGKPGKPEEDEADRFAADVLIPRDDWGAFVEGRNWSEQAVLGFAQDSEVHPGIVVGRLQHLKLLPSNRLTTLKSKYKWVE